MQIQLLEQRADVAGRLGQGPVVRLLARVAVTAQAHCGLSVRPADYRARRYRGAHGKIVGTAASSEGPPNSARYDNRQGVRPALG